MAKKFIGKENGKYIIDKKVRKNNKLGIITFVNYITCEGVKPKGAIKFFEDEKKWLEENNPSIEWEEIGG